MKKTLILILFAIVQVSFAGNPDGKDKNLEPIPAESSWMKSEVGIWMGNYNVWYKIDNKDNTLKLSYNKKKWTNSSTEAVWHDKYGRWMCIYSNKLMYSENGTNWKDVSNRAWQDLNGTWYRFDSNWDLWEVKLK